MRIKRWSGNCAVDSTPIRSIALRRSAPERGASYSVARQCRKILNFGGLLVLAFAAPVAAASETAASKTNTLCGTFAGSVFEFPKKYAFLFSEYEGKNFWEGGLVANKRGCTQNFASVPLRLIWPSFEHAKHLELDSSDTRVLHIDLKKAQPDKPYDVTAWLQSQRRDHQWDETKWLSGLNLNHQQSKSKVGDNFTQTRDLYWQTEDGRAPIAMECRDYPARPAICELEWRRTDMLVRAVFDQSHLQRWESIRTEIDEFVEKHKHGSDHLAAYVDAYDYPALNVPVWDTYTPLLDGLKPTDIAIGEDAIAIMKRRASDAGEPITDGDLAGIRRDLAMAYLTALSKQLREGASITRDIDYKESWDLRQAVFNAYRLPRPR